jgi:hypothetical protein
MLKSTQTFRISGTIPNSVLKDALLQAINAELRSHKLSDQYQVATLDALSACCVNVIGIGDRPVATLLEDGATEGGDLDTLQFTATYSIQVEFSPPTDELPI